MNLGEGTAGRALFSFKTNVVRIKISMKKSFLPWLIIPLLLLLFFLVRVWVLFHPAASGWEIATDEMPTGNIAHDVSRGLVLPATAYQFKAFAAGTVLEGLLSVPWRKVWGPNLLALKSAALTLHLLACLFWMLALRRLAGDPAAYVFGLLYAWPPPAWLHFTHMAWATHAEQSFFIGLIFLIMTHAWSGNEETTASNWKSCWLLGLISGFSIYFGYTGLVSVPWLLLIFFLFYKKTDRRRNILVWLTGLLVGLSPLLKSAAYYGWRRISVIDTPLGFSEETMVRSGRLFTENNLLATPHKFWRLLTDNLPALSLYPAAWVRWLFSLLILIGLAAWLFGTIKELGYGHAWKRRQSMGPKWRVAVLEAAPLLYALIYLTAFTISGFRIPPTNTVSPFDYSLYRYLAPLFPAAFALIALGFNAGWKMLAGRRVWQTSLALGALAVFSIINVPYYRQIAESRPSAAVLQTRGDYYFYFVDSAMKNTLGPLANKLAVAKKLPAPYRRLFFFDLGRVGDAEYLASLTRDDALMLEYAPYFLLGYGGFYGAQLNLKQPDSWLEQVDTLIHQYHFLPEKWQVDLLTGLGMQLGYEFKDEPVAEKLAPFEAWKFARPDEYQIIMQGVGANLHDFPALLAIDPAQLPDAFWQGIGWRLRFEAENALLSWERFDDFLRNRHTHVREQILIGFGQGADFFRP